MGVAFLTICAGLCKAGQAMVPLWRDRHALTASGPNFSTVALERCDLPHEQQCWGL